MSSEKTEIEKVVPTPMREKSDPVGTFILWALAVFSKLEVTPAAVGQNVQDMVLWRRMAAAIIDGIILFSFFKLANAIVIGGKNLTVILTPETFWIDALSVITPLLALKPVWIMFMGGVPLDSYDTFFFSPVFATMVILLYHALLESSPWQGSLGKKICGVVVTDTYGHRISFARALKRNAAKSITFLPYFIIRLITFNSSWVLPLFIYDVLAVVSCGGFAVALASLSRRCLHDAVADTLVMGDQQAERVRKAGPPLEELKATAPVSKRTSEKIIEKPASPLGKRTLESMAPPGATKPRAMSMAAAEAGTDEPEAAQTLTFESLDPGATQPISPQMAARLAREAAEEAARKNAEPLINLEPEPRAAIPAPEEHSEVPANEGEDDFTSFAGVGTPGEDMKECPACAEWIKAKAKKCRYCQERFE